MRHILSLMLLCLLAVPGFAQGNVAEAKRLAGVLSQQQELPVNVRLRFELARDMMGGLAGKGDPGSVLGFFSTTRILAWNQPVSPATGQALREFEQQVVALAKGKGVNLDLPPVGYSPVGAPSVAEPEAPTATGGSMLTTRSTREGLLEFTLRAEEMGTEALGRGANRELQAVRDSLTVLRQDLSDSQVSSDAVRNVLLARASYLASPASANGDRGFLSRLDAAAEALRSNFSPEVLRQARGQQLTI